MRKFIKRLYIFLLVFVSAFALMFSSACANREENGTGSIEEKQSIENNTGDNEDRDEENDEPESPNNNDEPENQSGSNETEQQNNDDKQESQNDNNNEENVDQEGGETESNSEESSDENQEDENQNGQNSENNTDNPNENDEHQDVVYVVSAQIKENNVIAYFGEDDCLDEILFEVTYSDGNKENHALKEADGDIDLRFVTDDPLEATFTYQDVEFSFNYFVKIREIEENHDYELIDEQQLFEDGVKIQIANNNGEMEAHFFKDDGENFQNILDIAVFESDNERYVSNLFVHNRKAMRFEIYAFKDKVVISEYKG